MLFFIQNTFIVQQVTGTFPGKEEMESSLQKLEKDLKETSREKDKALQQLNRLKQHLLEKVLYPHLRSHFFNCQSFPSNSLYSFLDAILGALAYKNPQTHVFGCNILYFICTIFVLCSFVKNYILI